MNLSRRRLLGLFAGSIGVGWLVAACRDAVSTPTLDASSAPATSTPPTTAPTTSTTATRPPMRPEPTPPAPEVLAVIGREGWSSRPRGEFRKHRIQRITIHHTAAELTDNTQAPTVMRRHQDWHMSHGWPDLAYHFIVDRNGNVYEGRPIDAVGDTFTEYDPTGHFLACFEGHFDRQAPSAEQIAAMTALVAWAMWRFAVPAARITGHRDWAATSCPGDDIYWRLGGLIRAASDHPRVELGYLHGDEARSRVESISAGA